MKKILLSTTAAFALVAAASLSAAQTNPAASPGMSGESHAAPSPGGTSAHPKGAQPERQGQAEPKGHSGSANERMGQGGKSNERLGNERLGQRQEKQGQKQDQKQGQKQGQAGKSSDHERMGQGGKSNERMGQGQEKQDQKQGQEKKGEGKEQRQERSGQTSGQHERMGQGREHQERTGESRQKERTGETREQRDQRGTQTQQERPQQQERLQQDRAGQNRTEGRVEHNDVKSVQLNQEQRTRIHETIIKEHAARIDHVDFDVRVGVRVPHTVRVFTIPADVVLIVPQYRGYKYIILRDEMIILDPDTLEIVAVVPV
jgi:hypothetical protein